MTATTTIKFIDGAVYTFAAMPKLSEVKALVLKHCAHDLNMHRSFLSAKTGRCFKCGLVVPRTSPVLG